MFKGTKSRVKVKKKNEVHQNEVHKEFPHVEILIQED